MQRQARRCISPSIDTNGRSTSWRASASSVTAHSVWANSACSSRSKSFESARVRRFVLLEQGAHALGEVFECSPDIAVSRFVERRMGYFHWGSPPQCFEFALSIVAEDHCPVFLLPLGCRDKLSPVLFHPPPRPLRSRQLIAGLRCHAPGESEARDGAIPRRASPRVRR